MAESFSPAYYVLPFQWIHSVLPQSTKADHNAQCDCSMCLGVGWLRIRCVRGW